MDLTQVLHILQLEALLMHQEESMDMVYVSTASFSKCNSYYSTTAKI